MLAFIAKSVCTPARCERLIGKNHAGKGAPAATERINRAQEVRATLIRAGGTVGRNYLHHLIERIEVDENRITVVPKEAFREVS